MLPIGHPALCMRNHNHYSEAGHLITIDQGSPDKIAARREALHETDGEDWDHEYAPDDGGEDVDLAGIKSIPRDALRTLLRFLVPSNSVSEKKRWRMMTIRTALMAHMLDIDGIGKKSLAQLGEELDCTRALLSLYTLRMIDGLGIDKTRNGKSRQAREVYRKSATEAHRRAGHTMSDTPAEVA